MTNETGPVSDWHANPRAARTGRGKRPDDPREVHRMLPDYSPTPLRDVPALADELGLRKLWVKDERARMNLPSFKVLGASYALARALQGRLGDDDGWSSFAQWQRAARELGPLTLAAATDGNHGHALAYLARLLGFGARIVVPSGVSGPRVDAIRAEGATVETVEGTYEDAVARVAGLDGTHLIVSDTAWEGYEQIPRWVIAGYETIFAEIDEQLAAAGERTPDAVLVQAGVGALACACVRHWRATDPATPVIVTVEPDDAACVLAALRAGRPQPVPGPHRSIMGGLNCGLVSRVALPALLEGLDGAISVTDAHARSALRLLDAAGIPCGETGGVGVAGLLALRGSAREVVSALRLSGADEVLVICTEGIGDQGKIAPVAHATAGEGLIEQ